MSSQVVDFGTNWKRVWDSLLDLSSNLGPILHSFRDIRAFVCRKPFYPYPTLFQAKFRGVLFGVDPWCWGLLISHKIIFEEFQPMRPRYFNVTDRQTDGRTTWRSNTALCVTSCGKNIKNKSVFLRWQQFHAQNYWWKMARWPRWVNYKWFDSIRTCHSFCHACRHDAWSLQVFKEIGVVVPLKKVVTGKVKLASKLATQALTIMDEHVPTVLSPRVPLWTTEDVSCWIHQVKPHVICSLGTSRFSERRRHCFCSRDRTCPGVLSNTVAAMYTAVKYFQVPRPLLTTG